MHRRNARPFSITLRLLSCLSKEKMLYEEETPKSRETEEESKESSSSSSEEEGEDEASESEAEKEAGNADAPARTLCSGRRASPACQRAKVVEAERAQGTELCVHRRVEPRARTRC